MIEAECLREFRSSMCAVFCNRKTCKKCPLNELDKDLYRRVRIGELLVHKNERKVPLLHD